MTAEGNRVTLITVPSMRFGHGVVIDPEVRVKRLRPGGSTGRTVSERCARRRCDCGTIYIAPLKDLFREDGRARKSCGCRARKGGPGRKKVRIQPNKGGYAIVAYMGWTKTRKAAEDVARRSRAVVLPESPLFVVAGERVGDIGAASGDGDDEPVSAQLRDGFPCGAARHAEFLLELFL